MRTERTAATVVVVVVVVVAAAAIASAAAADGQSPPRPAANGTAATSGFPAAENGTEYVDETSNMTDEEYQDYLVDLYIVPQKSEWAFIALHSVVFVVGLIGNALVCVAVYR